MLIIGSQAGPFTLGTGDVGIAVPTTGGHTIQVDFDVVGNTNANEIWLRGEISGSVINQHKGTDLAATTTPVHYDNILTLDPTCTSVVLWTTVNTKTFTNLVYTDLNLSQSYGQAQAFITKSKGLGQAQTLIHTRFGFDVFKDGVFSVERGPGWPNFPSPTMPNNSTWYSVARFEPDISEAWQFRVLADFQASITI